MKEVIYRTKDDRIQRMKDRRMLMLKLDEEDEQDRIQKKSTLEIGASDDVYELHADAVAKKVVSGEDASSLLKNQPPVNNFVQTKSESDVPVVTDQLQSSLSSSKGGGQNLSSGIQNEMGTKMGADLSDVKIHTDSNAHEMSESINAKAFTHGSDIYFKQGNFDTTSTEGKSLLAHELTHTVQQSGLSRKIQRAEGEDLLENTRRVKGTNIRVNETTPTMFEQLGTIYDAEVLLSDGSKPVIRSLLKADENKPSTDYGPLYQEFEKGLYEALHFAFKTVDINKGLPNSVDGDDLEMIANLAVQQDMSWMGGYAGVNAPDYIFQMTSKIGKERGNLSGADERLTGATNKKSDEDDGVQNWAEHIQNSFPGVDNSTTDFKKVVKNVRQRFSSEDLAKIPQTYAGNTGARSTMEITRYQLSQMDLMREEIVKSGLNVDQLYVLAEGIYDIAINEIDDIKRTEYSRLYTYIMKEYMPRVYAEQTKSKQYVGSGEMLKVDSPKGDSLISGLLGTIKSQPVNPTDVKQKQDSIKAVTDAFAAAYGDVEKKTKSTSGAFTPLQILARYNIFQTVIHEFFHYVTHPYFDDVVSPMKKSKKPGERSKYNILSEGITDLFSLYVWNKFRADMEAGGTDARKVRAVLEGWLPDLGTDREPKTIDWTVIPHYYLYESTFAAKELENKLGLDNLKAAYLLGHVELLELVPENMFTQAQKHESADGEPYFLAPAYGTLGLYEGTLFQAAFEKGLYTTLEGKEAVAARNQMLGNLNTDLAEASKKPEKHKKEIEELNTTITLLNDQIDINSAEENIVKIDDEIKRLTKVIADDEDKLKQLIIDLDKITLDIADLNEKLDRSEPVDQLAIKNDIKTKEDSKAQMEIDKIALEKTITENKVKLALEEKKPADAKKVLEDKQKEYFTDQSAVVLKQGIFPGKEMFFHQDTPVGRTIVIRGTHSVVALDDTTLDKFITLNGKDISVDSRERWKTWFLEQYFTQSGSGQMIITVPKTR